MKEIKIILSIQEQNLLYSSNSKLQTNYLWLGILCHHNIITTLNGFTTKLNKELEWIIHYVPNE